ncbi:zinc finger protein 845-like [Phlebotomus argentipes]|uniref:zinc finger protein 845-like n=1 Tax=Phlebotomus argentipes TaxID=94469 RepID=UPI0028934D1D|nr:zinc finger protein 845-like [Phlebotomus argentipes]
MGKRKKMSAKDQPEIIHVNIAPDFILCNVEYESCGESGEEKEMRKKTETPPKDGSVIKETKSKRKSEAAKEIFCQTCGKMFTRQRHLTRHEVIHTGEKPFSCDVCQKRFNRKDKLVNHRRYHKVPKEEDEAEENEDKDELKCNFCGETFSDKDQLRFHKKIHASSHELLTCMICKKMCSTTDELRQHYFTHTGSVQSKESGEKAQVFDCQYCYKSFLNGELLREHLVFHGMTPFSADDVVHKCTICEKTFSQAASLRQHMITHSRDYPCTCCEMTFNRRDKLSTHMKMHENAKEFLCTKCGRSFENMFKLDHHMRVHFGKTDHMCLICNKHFQMAKNLKRHMVVHTGLRPYQCDLCGNTYPRRDKLTAHLKVHANRGEMALKDAFAPKKLIEPVYPVFSDDPTVRDDEERGEELEDAQVEEEKPSPLPGEALEDSSENLGQTLNHPYIDPDDEDDDDEEIYDCVYCYKSFLQRDLLQTHLEDVHDAHLTEKIFLEQAQVCCPICNKEYGSQRALKRHLQTHSKEKTYKCPECAMSFDRFYPLVAHMKVHQRSKAFPCKLCGRSFDDATRLEYHMKIHTNQKDFKCKICNVGFQSTKNLRRHIQSIHVSEKPFKCPEEGCNYAFSRRDKYSAHVRSHQTVPKKKSRKCVKCQMVFKSSEEVKEHMLVHLKFLDCDQCEEKFARKKDLAQHRKSHEKSEDVSCSVCSKKFKLKRYLKAHMKTHGKVEELQQCEHCEETFETESQLEQHTKSHIDRSEAIGLNVSIEQERQPSLEDIQTSSQNS